MLEVGMKAPAFTLPDKDGNLVSLSDFPVKSEERKMDRNEWYDKGRFSRKPD